MNNYKETINFSPKSIFYIMPLKLRFHSICRFVFYLYKMLDLYFTEV